MVQEVPKIREREKWDNKIEFFLSSIGFAVGLGNVWRFPYLCYKNGGGAFFIPYLICLILGGVPMFYLEVALGQFTSQGGITTWSTFAPQFKGIGYASCITCFLLNIYYIVILAWAIHYFFSSFTYDLPWSSCDHAWNTDKCFDPSMLKSMNSTDTSVGSSAGLKSSVVEYWENRVLGLSTGIDDVGSIRWELAATLFLAWVLVYFCIWKGVKSTGKVVYFTATFPYLMMTILLIRGLTLNGAWEGIRYYLTPDYSALFKGQVWIDAGTQIFFSYAVALGCMTALGSYNKFNHNFLRDCTWIVACNCGTSLYAGFVIFSVLGFMAQEQGVPISEVAESGPGLAFIAYPKAVSQMPWAPLWSILFFLMIIILGLDSQFVGVEGFVTAVVDAFPHILRVGYRREIFIAIIAVFSYCVGLLMVTNGGMYVFQIFDYYAASGMTLLWICFWESVAVAWFYGVGRFCSNVKTMVGYLPTLWLPIAWTYFTPVVTMAILLHSIINYEPLTYNKTYRYPLWAEAIGWGLALASMLCVPVYYMFYQTKDSIHKAEEREREKEKLKPEEKLLYNHSESQENNMVSSYV
ncbi:unnamed protein product [Allacma fusca]|uniref:Transporter n=1 Tax=Allacma fusca TaxID=39272 RepID=A0A8J2NZR9_9HEXA|nr:unnamed protein product [Allacma fusca]